MKRSLLLSFAGLSSVLALGPLMGCGAAEPEALAVLEGHLLNPQNLATPTSLRVAVVWLSREPGALTAAQDIEVEPVFPSTFKLALHHAPPDSTMFDKEAVERFLPSSLHRPESWEEVWKNERELEGSSLTNGTDNLGSRDIVPDLETMPNGVRIAMGSLVAYEDNNGNGTLDLVDMDATSFVDRIVATNYDLTLFYAEGTVDAWSTRDMEGRAIAPGYQLLRVRRPPEGVCGGFGDVVPGQPLPPYQEPTDECFDAHAETLPVETVFDLPMSDEPMLSALMCANDGYTVTWMPPSTDPGPDGYPAREDVFCEGKHYQHTACETRDSSLCGHMSTCVERLVLRPEGATPAGWPCDAP